MLQSLQIRDVVLIQSLDLDFHSGLVVLTGETGAGKSILLDSLGLALGDRAETSLIRNGASKAQVTASFQLPSHHFVCKQLKEQDIEAENGQVIIRRVLTTEGRNKCFINDQPVTQGFLKQIARHLVEIHGQFDNLLDSKYHRSSLDIFSKLDTQATQSAYEKWKVAEKKFNDAKLTLETAKEREAFVRFSKEELEKLSPKDGEEEQLTEQRARVANGSKIAESAQLADQILSGENTISNLVNAQKALQKVEEYLPNEITPLVETLERAIVEVQEAACNVQSLVQDVKGDSQSLEALDDRLHELRSLARKHHVAIDELPQLLERLSSELSQIDQGDEALEDLQQDINNALEIYKLEAGKLSNKRQKQGLALQELISKELPPLKLDQANFTVNIERVPETQWADYGWDQIAFHVSTNPGSPSGPLNKIASGGELSRLMLALKVILSQNTQTSSLIFDEIDSGTGGAVAAAIGERLKELSNHMQVLVITHSPQVAALGDQHLQVSKSVDQGQTTTHVVELSDEERLEEVARMLSGSLITKEARAQAKQLMAA